MRSFFVGLIMSVVGSLCAEGESLEVKFRGMVNEVKSAVSNEKSPNLDAVGNIIAKYCNMDTVCTYVASSYIKSKTKDMNSKDKVKFITDFLSSFKPVYTAYLARVWASDNNAQTFSKYEIAECNVKDKRVEIKFDQSGKSSYVVLELDDKNLIRSIKFGDKRNLIDPISADRGSCEAGVSQGKEPEVIFAQNSK